MARRASASRGSLALRGLPDEQDARGVPAEVLSASWRVGGNHQRPRGEWSPPSCFLGGLRSVALRQRATHISLAFRSPSRSPVPSSALASASHSPCQARFGL